GLVPTTESADGSAFVEAAGEAVSRYLDLDRVLAVARVSSGEWRVASEENNVLATCHSSLATLAVARDEAFHFIYEENLEMLQVAGARLAFFSPLRDAELPEGATGVILSGGFPEIHAARLAANLSMKQALRDAHERGLPIYAECGGLMYLTQSIVDLEGRAHGMAGLLPGSSVMSKRLTLGYRQARAVGSSWLFAGGETVRGHEFHYSQWVGRPADLPPAYMLLPSNGAGEPWVDGACVGNLWVSYVHLNFWAKPALAQRFVAACRG
ncbi:MAG TPA: hypothetical protein VMF69_16285, partial [Gemmataceae bacterium]|nr:hypothetical protein [Gemmataceae bacterium]